MNLAERLSWVLGKEVGSVTEPKKSATDIELYRCKKCGYYNKSLGFLHGHMEGHTPWYSIADVDQFMEWTEKISVKKYTVEKMDSEEK